MKRPVTIAVPLAVLATSLLLAGCDIRVRKDSHGRDADVDIRTPFGRLAARTDVDAKDTGLPVYPGARPLRDRDEGDSAGVRIRSSFFDFDVAAAKFESEDAPAAIVAFYRDAMGTYGDVVECRGDIDFEGRNRRRRPVCDEDRSERETQLVVGNEDHHRTIVVKPRGRGSEFAIVHVNTRQGS